MKEAKECGVGGWVGGWGASKGHRSPPVPEKVEVEWGGEGEGEGRRKEAHLRALIVGVGSCSIDLVDEGIAKTENTDGDLVTVIAWEISSDTTDMSALEIEFKCSLDRGPFTKCMYYNTQK